jgi:hypothetical protein
MAKTTNKKAEKKQRKKAGKKKAPKVFTYKIPKGEQAVPVSDESIVETRPKPKTPPVRVKSVSPPAGSGWMASASEGKRHQPLPPVTQMPKPKARPVSVNKAVKGR